MEKNKASAPVYIANLFSYFAIGLLNLAIVKIQSVSLFGVDLNEFKSAILIGLPGVGFIIAHYLGVFLTFAGTSRAEKQLNKLNRNYKNKCIAQLADPHLDEEEKEKIRREYAILSADERALANANYSAGRDRFKKADESLQNLRDQSPEDNTGLEDLLGNKNK